MTKISNLVKVRFYKPTVEIKVYVAKLIKFWLNLTTLNKLLAMGIDMGLFGTSLALSCVQAKTPLPHQPQSVSIVALAWVPKKQSQLSKRLWCPYLSALLPALILISLCMAWVLQGDPNQNLGFQMTIAVKQSISDPTLIKPKCVWEAVVYFNFLTTFAIFSFVFNFSK